MIKLGPVILVEGKYDKIKLSQIFDATILTTDGFGIFKQKDKLDLLRRLAETRGLLVFTDPDGAGFVIRNYLKGAVPKGTIYHAYIPDLYGKEKRKAKGSKEGKLGVEGVPDEVILRAVEQSGALTEETPQQGGITKADLFELGLSGGAGSVQRRQRLLKDLQLPQQLSPNALLDVLNCITDLEALTALVQNWEEEHGTK
jgi:ribonuclease M5